MECLTTLVVKNFFVYNLYLHSFSLKVAIKSPSSLLFSRLNNSGYLFGTYCKLFILKKWLILPALAIAFSWDELSSENTLVFQVCLKY